MNAVDDSRNEMMYENIPWHAEKSDCTGSEGSRTSSSATMAANNNGQNLIFFKKFGNWLLLIEGLSILEPRTLKVIYILLSVMTLYWPQCLWMWNSNVQMNKSISQGLGIDPDMFSKLFI